MRFREESETLEGEPALDVLNAEPNADESSLLRPAHLDVIHRSRRERRTRPEVECRRGAVRHDVRGLERAVAANAGDEAVVDVAAKHRWCEGSDLVGRRDDAVPVSREPGRVRPRRVDDGLGEEAGGETDSGPR